jgi:hypothetical protein
MHRESTYQAARLVAQPIAQHFTRAVTERFPHSLLLDRADHATDVIESLIDAAFWSSLRREEGYIPKISLALLPPDQTPQAMRLAQPLELSPAILTKLAPAVERPGIHLGVWLYPSGLRVWGATRYVPVDCLILEVIEPGLLVVKHRRTDGLGKFANVAILQGDQIKLVDDRGTRMPDDYPPLLTSLLDFSVPVSWNDSVNVLLELAVSMREHGRGGTLLVVPSESDTWRESVIHPLSYPIAPAFSALSSLVDEDLNTANPQAWRNALSLAIDGMAGLTAVDGATLVNDRYELLGFGVKTTRSERSERVEQVLITEPIVDNEPQVVHPTRTGGTRHISAAQFVYDQREAIALVASQDGRFTIFAWSDPLGIVRAHRVDCLLL